MLKTRLAILTMAFLILTADTGDPTVPNSSGS